VGIPLNLWREQNREGVWDRVTGDRLGRPVDYRRKRIPLPSLKKWGGIRREERGFDLFFIWKGVGEHEQPRGGGK